MALSKKWALLEHTDSPEDPIGLHFDFLLEDNHGCRSWRLRQMPILDGPPQEAIPIAVHSLEWLEISEREGSGGRGWAKRLITGFFSGELPDNDIDPVEIKLYSKEMSGSLEIKNFRFKFSSL